MAQKKFETIELAAVAMGVEVTDITRPFLKAFVIKDPGAVYTWAKKKELFDEAEMYGVVIEDKAKETVDSLKVRIVETLFTEDRHDELKLFCDKNKLAVNEEGKLFRVKAAVKAIEDRVAGQREGTIGNLSIKLLQDERYADKSISDLQELFAEYCVEAGFPELGAKGTTIASLQWYVNYCRKHFIAVVERKKAGKAAKVEGGKQLGAELTLEKALKPKGFANKKPETAEAGESLDLSGDDEGAGDEGEMIID